MSEYAINVKHVSKKFRLFHEKRDSIYESATSFFQKKRHYEILLALDDISFNVKRGEIFGIIGPNGCGKTTLLKIISKIYAPNSGSVDVEGTIIPVLSLGLGFHPELTAVSNIYQSSVLLGFKKGDISKRVHEIIKFAELEQFADTKIKNFSAGMQMRLAFATTILTDPDILILDEVFAVGDVRFQKKCFDSIMSFKKRGKAIVFVSHDMTPIRDYCDRVIFLNRGKIKAIGKPDAVVSSYIASLESKTLESKTLESKTLESKTLENRFSSQLPFENILLIGTLDFQTVKHILKLKIGKSIDVIDNNLENIKNCISQKKFLPINYFYKSYDSITGLNKKYDAIFCGPILNYIQNLDLFFNSLIGLLNQNGLVFIHDYVGPFKMIFSNKHLKLLNEINSNLPKKYRTNYNLAKLPDQNLQHMVANSESIQDIFTKYFDIHFARELNGGIAYPIIWGNVEKFNSKSGIKSKEQLKSILKSDEIFSKNRDVPILFWYCVGRNKK